MLQNDYGGFDMLQNDSGGFDVLQNDSGGFDIYSGPFNCVQIKRKVNFPKPLIVSGEQTLYQNVDKQELERMVPN